MPFPLEEIPSRELFAPLAEIPDPPKRLFYKGALPPSGAKHLAVVGSRNYTDYGRQVVDYLLHGLSGYHIAIISGLALGIDALAHEAALEANLYTAAIPGSGLDDAVLYPRQNRALASRILEEGGGLISEYEPTFKATNWSFPQRNRIMAGLSHAVLIIEAAERSGTLITARLAADYNRELLVVPGNIFSGSMKGNHQFLKLGATPVTEPEDIIEVLHAEKSTENDVHEEKAAHHDSDEAKLLSLLQEPMDRDAVMTALEMPSSAVNILLMKLELQGAIREQNDLFYKV